MGVQHGGDWATFQAEHGAMPLDFSANVSPLGMPESVRAAVIESLKDAARYPDPRCRALRRKLAVRHELSPEDILCGNGAADLIYRLCYAVRPGCALVTAPAFGEYEQALRQVDCTVRRFHLRAEEGFKLPDRFLEALTPDLDIAFLCQPNNPAGTALDRGLLRRILDRCRDMGTLMCLDECFADFLGEDDSCAALVPQYPDLFVLRAFTKWYGIPGLRLGYGLCGDRSLLARMAASGPPWAVSSVAQAAGIAALEDADYGVRLRTLMEAERPRMQRALQELGLRVVPGTANFLLFYTPDARLGEKLARKNILIRDCSDYPGLEPGWFRIAIRTREENDKLLAAMKEVCAWQSGS